MGYTVKAYNVRQKRQGKMGDQAGKVHRPFLFDIVEDRSPKVRLFVAHAGSAEPPFLSRELSGTQIRSNVVNPMVNCLVVLAILKNMKVNGKDDIPHMKWKIKAMFQTTNQ